MNAGSDSVLLDEGEFNSFDPILEALITSIFLVPRLTLDIGNPRCGASPLNI